MPCILDASGSMQHRYHEPPNLVQEMKYNYPNVAALIANTTVPFNTKAWNLQLARTGRRWIVSQADEPEPSKCQVAHVVTGA